MKTVELLDLYLLNEIEISDTEDTEFVFESEGFKCIISLIPNQPFEDVLMTKKSGDIWWVSKFVAFDKGKQRVNVTMTHASKEEMINTVYNMAETEFIRYENRVLNEQFEQDKASLWSIGLRFLITFVIISAIVYYFVS